MNYIILGLIIFIFFIGIIIGWFINSHISANKLEKLQTEKYRHFSFIRKKIRRKFYNEISHNIEILKNELKESALTRSIETQNFSQKCFRKNIFKLKDRPAREMIRTFYVNINKAVSATRQMSMFYQRFIKENSDLSSEQKNDIQMSLINLKLNRLDKLNKLGAEVISEMKKLEMVEE